MSDRIDPLLELLAQSRALESAAEDDGPLFGPHCLALERLLQLAEGRQPSSTESRHLTDCEACSARLAAMRRALALGVGGRASRGRPRSSLHHLPGPWLWRVGGVALAAAGLMLLGWLWFQRAGAPGGEIEFDVASSKADLFHELRSSEQGPEFFLGLELERAAWLRLLVLDERGGLILWPLDPDGSLTLHGEGGLRHEFGGYARRWGDPPHEARAFVWLVTRQLLDEAEARRLVDAPEAWSLERLEALAPELGERLGARVLLGPLR